ncbi:hypothetical protein RclHR1_00280023 [Rhizophagus clarus]|uniref:Uncharacterized protein n=1 Tax=Rhizophagus clarus TaxID=94130 RepID=A0A2Z6RIK1_9GLOM|nr:hypothetical protein RclHR1_00280023 [Rhizophagus clarus]
MTVTSILTNFYNLGGRLLLYYKLEFLVKRKEEEKKSYSTQYSHVVPNRSTDWAISGLTSEIGRVPVLFTVYGRN